MSSRSTSLRSHRTSRRPWRAKTFAVATGLAGAALALAACGNGSGTSGYRAAAAPTSSAPTAAAPAAAELTTASTSLGTILVDGRGKTVYRFAADTKGHSNCSGACAQYWHALTATANLPTAASTVTAQLGTITRSDGAMQVTANGWPLYTFVGDNAPGATSGQGQTLNGGRWWVVSSAGAQITTNSSGPSPSASMSSSYGRSY
jgi:predicted lipoprotein with Yx(FWY)xxD motif